MKRLLALVLALSLCLAGCGGDTAQADAPELRYFVQAPEIPRPDSLFDLKESPRQQENTASFFYEQEGAETLIQTTVQAYLTQLTQLGFTVRPAEGCYVVSKDGADRLEVSVSDSCICLKFLNGEETAEPEAETEAQEIRLETPLVLQENIHFRVELLGFWKRPGGVRYSGSYWETRPEDAYSYGVDIQFYNKSDVKYYVSAETSLDGEPLLSHVQIGNGSMSPAPGENARMQLTVLRWESGREQPMTLEELYDLTGVFTISDVSRMKYAFSIFETMEAAGITPERQIRFEPYVLVAENDHVKIELVRFYEEQSDWGSHTTVEKLMEFRITNKDRREMRIQFYGYTGDEKVLVNHQSSVGDLDPGKSELRSYRITQQDMARTPLDTLKELYTFHGTFEIQVRANGNVVEVIEIPCNLEEAIASAKTFDGLLAEGQD